MIRKVGLDSLQITIRKSYLYKIDLTLIAARDGLRAVTAVSNICGVKAIMLRDIVLRLKNELKKNNKYHT